MPWGGEGTKFLALPASLWPLKINFLSVLGSCMHPPHPFFYLCWLTSGLFLEVVDQLFCLYFCCDVDISEKTVREQGRASSKWWSHLQRSYPLCDLAQCASFLCASVPWTLFKEHAQLGPDLCYITVIIIKFPKHKGKLCKPMSLSQF